MRFFFSMVFLVLAIFVSVVSAEEYPVGFTNGDGYAYSGSGIWTLNGASYTRSLYQSQASGTWSCGVYYPGTWKSFYQYAAYVPPAPKQEYLPSYKDAEWKTKLLEIASNRDKVEGQIRKEAYDHAQYIDAIRALGLTGNFRWEGYGTIPPYVYGGLGGSGYQQGGSYQQGHYRQMPYEVTGAINYGATANTQYGYSVNTIAQLYGANGLESLYQQAGQLTDRALTLGGQASTEFKTLVGQEGTNRARIAEVLARGQLIREIGSALQVPDQPKSFNFRFKQGGQIERIPVPNIDGATLDGNRAAFHAVFAESCAQCHTGADAKGKFTEEAYLAAPLDLKQKVWSILVTDDPKTMMPRGSDGGPGKRLTPTQFRAFIMN